VCVCVCVYQYIYIYLYLTHTHKHTHKHTHTHSHTHTHRNTNLSDGQCVTHVSSSSYGMYPLLILSSDGQCGGHSLRHERRCYDPLCTGASERERERARARERERESERERARVTPLENARRLTQLTLLNWGSPPHSQPLCYLFEAPDFWTDLTLHRTHTETLPKVLYISDLT